MSRPAFITSLWRYPLKSFAGELLATVNIEQEGLAGDRVYALYDRAMGRVVSAKNPAKWAGTLSIAAKLICTEEGSEKLAVILPDGTKIIGDTDAMSHQLSIYFDRQVTVISQKPNQPLIEIQWTGLENIAPADTTADVPVSAQGSAFFDCKPIHIITTNTLTKLSTYFPEGQFDTRRFRPNIVIDAGPQCDFIENSWLGQCIDIGENVRLQITEPTVRCIMTTLAQAELPPDRNILKTIAQHNRVNLGNGYSDLPCAGVYAEVLQPGTIKTGDIIRIVR